MNGRTHVFGQISTIDSSSAVCRLSLTIVFFSSAGKKRGAKDIIKRSRLYPCFDRIHCKMWVHWGSMLSIHNTVLLGRAALTDKSGFGTQRSHSSLPLRAPSQLSTTVGRGTCRAAGHVANRSVQTCTNQISGI